MQKMTPVFGKFVSVKEQMPEERRGKDGAYISDDVITFSYGEIMSYFTVSGTVNGEFPLLHPNAWMPMPFGIKNPLDNEGCKEMIMKAAEDFVQEVFYGKEKCNEDT